MSHNIISSASIEKTGKNSGKRTETEKVSLNIDDILIVRQISEVQVSKLKDPNSPNLTDKNVINEEYENVLKRELQASQAEERGKKALLNEISQIKKIREERNEALRRRQKVLEVEKERSRKIAALPPPLPVSIKSLLREREKKICENKEMDENQDPEQSFFGVEGSAFGSRREDYNLVSNNKANVLTFEERLEKERIKADSDRQAVKRYNEALKKDRMRQQCDNALKQIENAELAHRRLQAKSISIKGGNVPCAAPDNITHCEKQVRMEDAVENIYKNNPKGLFEDEVRVKDPLQTVYKSNPKEHAIEDLEGYKDMWEEKYKKADSASNIIDCTPKFVKENYSYLLEDESIYRCGNRFSGLDESFNPLNMAYIESPPSNQTDDAFITSDDMDKIMKELDKMRANTNEIYEKEFKPLLQKHQDQKMHSVADKAIEAQLLKAPTEDKSVENCNFPFYNETASASVQVNLLNGGVMDFQRRNSGTRLMPSMDNNHSPSQRTHIDYQPNSQSETWSSSSYFSLPSKHGMPNLHRDKDSSSFTKTQSTPKECIPLSKAPRQLGDVSSFGLESRNIASDENEREMHSTKDSKENESLDSQQVYDDQLRRSKLAFCIRKVVDKYMRNDESTSCAADTAEISLESDHQRFNFNQKRMEKDRVDSSSVLSDQNSPISPAHSFRRISSKDTEAFLQHRQQYVGMQEKVDVPVSISWDGQPYQSDDSGLKSMEESSSLSTNLTKTKEVVNDRVSYETRQFRELSTIQEMDSALTNDAAPSFTNLSVSLLDPPPSKISELVQSVKFVQNATGSNARDPLLLVSGTIDDLQTPKSNKDPSTLKMPCSSTMVNKEVHEHNPVSTEHGTLSVEQRTVLTDSDISLISTVSQRTPYSSSFQDSYRRPPYLTNVDTLPKYFEDVSTVKLGNRFIRYHGGFERTLLFSNISDTPSVPAKLTSKDKKMTWEKQVSEQGAASDSSGGSFQAVTPVSHVSSTPHSLKGGIPMPFDQFPHENSSSSFAAISPGSYISSSNPSPRTDISNKIRSHEKIHTEQAHSDSNSWKPLTPVYSSNYEPSNQSQVSTFSSISNSSKLTQRSVLSGRVTEDDSAGSFTNITSHSSSPYSFQQQISGKDEAVEENVQQWYAPIPANDSDESIEHARADSRLTCASAPLLEENISFEILHSESSALSSKSGKLDQESKTCHKQFLPTSEDCRFSDSSFDSKSPNGPQYLRNIATKGDVRLPKKHIENFMVNSQSLNNKEAKMDIEKPGEKVVEDSVVKHSLPVLSGIDLQPTETDCANLRRKKFSSYRHEAQSPCNGISDSKDTNNGNILSKAVQSNLDGKNYCSDSIGFNGAKSKQEALVLPLKEKYYLPLRSNLSTAKQSKEDLSTLIMKNIIQHHVLPISSSSNSKKEFCSSMINYNSNPTKPFRDIFESTGIMEEPDLTLVNSQMTLRLESPEKQSLQLECNLKGAESQSRKQNPDYQIATFSTPEPASIQEDAYCESPSLLSFMRHEVSCLAEDIQEVSPMPQVKMTSKPAKGVVEKKGKPTSKNTPGHDYKSRTKRLYSNLEEVRSRKALEEKREQMLKNKMKAKAYSKKLATPIKKK